MRPLRGRLGLLLALAAVCALFAVALALYAVAGLARFQQAEILRGTLVYAAPQVLRPGVHVGRVDLAAMLSRLGYRETGMPPTAPGQFRRAPGVWEVVPRGGDEDRRRGARRVRLELEADRIVRIIQGGKDVEGLTLEPEVVASAGGLPGETYRPVRLAEIPPALRNAVLAAEDERFFEHGGVDLRALARALWVNLRAGRVVEGGSTITQQLVKNRLLGPQRTLWRKLKEAWLSAAIEWRYSKEQIFEIYLNEVYLGNWGGSTIRGVGAGARAYFRKEVPQLTLAEAALLAGMIRAPNISSPGASVERARSRRDAVLARLRELGRVSDTEYQRARRESIRPPVGPIPGPVGPYFVDYVRLELEQDPTLETAPGQRAQIFSSLDPSLQRFAQAAVARGLDRLETQVPHLRRPDPAERLQAALIVLEPGTGKIRAMVGGRDYRASQFNRAVLARRQPGSAFKPLVYLAALTARHGGPAFTAASIVNDEPITVVADGKPWSPRNYQDRYEGRVTVRRALERSLNAATVQIAQAVGWAAVVETARTLGIESELKPVPAVALGSFEVTPLELARAYLPLASGGVAHAVRAVEGVSDGTTRVQRIAKDESRQALSPAEAYLMTSLLQGVIDSGTAAGARGMGVAGPVAGKTGTTNEGRDAWFVGYSSNLLALVWVGFDDGRPNGLSGAEAALPIWADFMKQALDAYPPAAFAVPPGVTLTVIDVTNGKRANPSCPLVASEVFLAGTEPEVCEEHGGVTQQIHRWWDRLWDWLHR